MHAIHQTYNLRLAPAGAAEHEVPEPSRSASSSTHRES